MVQSKEEINLKQKAWRTANAEKKKAGQKAWRDANPTYTRTWQKEHPEEYNIILQRWRDRQPKKPRVLRIKLAEDEKKARQKQYRDSKRKIICRPIKVKVKLPAIPKKRQSPEELKEKQKLYYKKHSEELIARQKLYYKEHSERQKARQKRNYHYHPKEKKPKSKACSIKKERIVSIKKPRPPRKNKYIPDKERLKINKQKYWKTVKGKLASRRYNAKRKRDYGYIPLNIHIDGMHGHHIDKHNIIFMPVYLHTSVWHQQKDNKSMQRINMLAWDYLEASSY